MSSRSSSRSSRDGGSYSDSFSDSEANRSPAHSSSSSEDEATHAQEGRGAIERRGSRHNSTELAAELTLENTVVYLNSRGEALGSEGDFVGADESLRAAYKRLADAGSEGIGHQRHSELVAMTLNNLGVLYRKKSNYSLAIQYLEAVKRIEEQDLAGSSATTYLNLASAYSAVGRFKDAARAADKTRALLFEKHPSPEAVTSASDHTKKLFGASWFHLARSYDKITEKTVTARDAIQIMAWYRKALHSMRSLGAADADETQFIFEEYSAARERLKKFIGHRLPKAETPVDPPAFPGDRSCDNPEADARLPLVQVGSGNSNSDESLIQNAPRRQSNVRSDAEKQKEVDRLMKRIGRQRDEIKKQHWKKSREDGGKFVEDAHNIYTSSNAVVVEQFSPKFRQNEGKARRKKSRYLQQAAAAEVEEKMQKRRSSQVDKKRARRRESAPLPPIQPRVQHRAAPPAAPKAAHTRGANTSSSGALPPIAPKGERRGFARTAERQHAQQQQEEDDVTEAEKQHQLDSRLPPILFVCHNFIGLQLLFGAAEKGESERRYPALAAIYDSHRDEDALFPRFTLNGSRRKSFFAAKPPKTAPGGTHSRFAEPTKSSSRKSRSDTEQDRRSSVAVDDDAMAKRVHARVRRTRVLKHSAKLLEAQNLQLTQRTYLSKWKRFLGALRSSQPILRAVEVLQKNNEKRLIQRYFVSWKRWMQGESIPKLPRQPSSRRPKPSANVTTFVEDVIMECSTDVTNAWLAIDGTEDNEEEHAELIRAMNVEKEKFMETVGAYLDTEDGDAERYRYLQEDRDEDTDLAAERITEKLGALFTVCIDEIQYHCEQNTQLVKFMLDNLGFCCDFHAVAARNNVFATIIENDLDEFMDILIKAGVRVSHIRSEELEGILGAVVNVPEESTRRAVVDRILENPATFPVGKQKATLKPLWTDILESFIHAERGFALLGEETSGSENIAAVRAITDSEAVQVDLLKEYHDSQTIFTRALGNGNGEVYELLNAYATRVSYDYRTEIVTTRLSCGTTCLFESVVGGNPELVRTLVLDSHVRTQVNDVLTLPKELNGNADLPEATPLGFAQRELSLYTTTTLADESSVGKMKSIISILRDFGATDPADGATPAASPAMSPEMTPQPMDLNLSDPTIGSEDMSMRKDEQPAVGEDSSNDFSFGSFSDLESPKAKSTNKGGAENADGAMAPMPQDFAPGDVTPAAEANKEEDAGGSEGNATTEGPADADDVSEEKSQAASKIQRAQRCRRARRRANKRRTDVADAIDSRVKAETQESGDDEAPADAKKPESAKATVVPADAAATDAKEEESTDDSPADDSSNEASKESAADDDAEAQERGDDEAPADAKEKESSEDAGTPAKTAAAADTEDKKDSDAHSDDNAEATTDEKDAAADTSADTTAPADETSSAKSASDDDAAASEPTSKQPEGEAEAEGNTEQRSRAAGTIQRVQRGSRARLRYRKRRATLEANISDRVTEEQSQAEEVREPSEPSAESAASSDDEAVTAEDTSSTVGANATKVTREAAARKIQLLQRRRAAKRAYRARRKRVQESWNRRIESEELAYTAEESMREDFTSTPQPEQAVPDATVESQASVTVLGQQPSWFKKEQESSAAAKEQEEMATSVIKTAATQAQKRASDAGSDAVSTISSDSTRPALQALARTMLDVTSDESESGEFDEGARFPALNKFMNFLVQMHQVSGKSNVEDGSTTKSLSNDYEQTPQEVTEESTVVSGTEQPEAPMDEREGEEEEQTAQEAAVTETAPPFEKFVEDAAVVAVASDHTRVALQFAAQSMLSEQAAATADVPTFPSLTVFMSLVESTQRQERKAAAAAAVDTVLHDAARPGMKALAQTMLDVAKDGSEESDVGSRFPSLTACMQQCAATASQPAAEPQAVTESAPTNKEEDEKKAVNEAVVEEEPEPEPKTTLRILRCCGLTDEDPFGGNDPYVVVKLTSTGEELYRTIVKEEAGDKAEWANASVEIPAGTASLTLELWDEDTSDDDLIGRAEVTPAPSSLNRQLVVVKKESGSSSGTLVIAWVVQ